MQNPDSFLHIPQTKTPPKNQCFPFYEATKPSLGTPNPPNQ